MTPDDQTLVGRLLATLDPEDRAAALRVVQREASKTAPAILNSGKKKVIPEGRLQKDSRREVSTLVQEVTVEYIVGLIKRKEPTVSQTSAASAALTKGVHCESSSNCSGFQRGS